MRSATLPGAVLATHALRGLTIHEDRVEAAAGHPFPDLVRRSVESSAFGRRAADAVDRS